MNIISRVLYEENWDDLVWYKKVFAYFVGAGYWAVKFFAESYWVDKFFRTAELVFYGLGCVVTVLFTIAIYPVAYCVGLVVVAKILIKREQTK